MANTVIPPTPPGAEQAEGPLLPALLPSPVEPALATVFHPVLSAARDLVAGVVEAGRAVTRVQAAGGHDVTVGAATVLECAGESAADALHAAADAVRHGELTVHGLLYARVPFIEEEPDAEPVWEHRVTVLVSAVDPELGESDTPIHQAAAGTARVRLYLDADHDTPQKALTALSRDGLSQAEALQAAANLLRGCPELAVEGLQWARVAGRRKGLWEFLVTVLTSSTGPEHGRTDEPTYLDEQAGQ
jgi:hypothetical protein